MGVFAKLLRRSSSKSTQDSREATPVDETAAEERAAEQGDEAAQPLSDAGAPGQDAARSGDGESSWESPSAAEAEARERTCDTVGADDAAPEADTADTGAGTGEASVGIPKQPSADQAADSETGENARK